MKNLITEGRMVQETFKKSLSEAKDRESIDKKLKSIKVTYNKNGKAHTVKLQTALSAGEDHPAYKKAKQMFDKITGKKTPRKKPVNQATDTRANADDGSSEGEYAVKDGKIVHTKHNKEKSPEDIVDTLNMQKERIESLYDEIDRLKNRIETMNHPYD